MQAVILAGGQNNGEVKALKSLGGKAMLEYVLEALQASGRFSRIVIVGDKQRLASFRSADNIVTAGGSNIIGSLLNGISCLADEDNFLAVTGDIPFLTAAAVQDFLDSCTGSSEIYYPIVSRAVITAAFPKAERTYVKLKEGEFTGGNLMLINKAALKKCLPLAAKLAILRKSPLKLAWALGWKFIWQFILHKLTVQAIIGRLFAMTGIKAAAVISPYAEIGMDIDKPSDEAIARQFFATKGHILS